MNVTQIQAAIASMSRDELIAVLLVGSFLGGIVYVALRAVKRHHDSKQTLKKLASHSSDAVDLDDISQSKITIQHLQAQVKKYQRQLALMTPLNHQHEQEHSAGKLTVDATPEALNSDKQKPTLSLTREKIQQLNQRQRAQYHFRVKQAKQLSQQLPTMSCENNSHSQTTYQQELLALNMNTEQWQLIELLNKA